MEYRYAEKRGKKKNWNPGEGIKGKEMGLTGEVSKSKNAGIAYQTGSSLSP